MNIFVVLLFAALGWATAFVPLTPSQIRSVSPLFEVIRADVEQLVEVDPRLGGVQLTEESSIKINGEVRHKPGNAEARPFDLTRYTKLTSVEESKVKDVLGKVGGKIIATGQGKEFYKDPGTTVESVVILAPIEAAKDAVNAAASAIEEDTIIFNFLGGDELVIGQVLEATNEAVVNMDIATKANVYFNSMSDRSVPADTCTVTVLSIGGDDSSESSFSTGVEEAIAAGEAYFMDGKWWTVEKANVNTALE